MSGRPPLLPEEQDKRSTRPAPVVRGPVSGRRRGLLVALTLLVFLLAAGWVTTVIVIGFRPDAIGYQTVDDADATAASFAGTAESLAQAAQSVAGTAQFVAAAAVANAETQAALQNREQLLDQSATQAAADAQATQVAQAADDARQATQAAVDFAGTQAAFDRQATQAEIQFQGTQAALNRDATAVALGFATAPPDTLPTFAPQPTPLFGEGATQGVDGSLWTQSAVTDWTVDNGALVAQESGAWLLTRRGDNADYGFVADFVLPPAASFLYVLLSVPPDGDGGVAVEVFYDGEQVTAVSLYALTAAALDGSLAEASLQELANTAISITPADAGLQVQVEVRGEQVVVYLNDSAVLQVALTQPLPPGAVGVSLPAGTRVERLALLP